MFIVDGPFSSMIAVLIFVMFPYLAIRDIAKFIKRRISQEKSRAAGQRRKEEWHKKETEWREKEEKWDLWKKQWDENKCRERELRDAIEAASAPEEEAALRTQLIALLREMPH